MPRFLLPATVVAALAAFIGGWWLGETLAPAQIAGDIFLRLLRLLVVPLVVTSMVKAVAGLKDFRSLGTFGARTLAYYLFTMSLAVGLGMSLCELIAPGRVLAATFAQDGPGMTVPAANVSGRDFLLAVFPDNLFAALARGDILPLILLSLVFGAALVAVGRGAQPVATWFDALDRVILRLTHWVLFFTPLGVFGLIAGRIAQTGGGEALTRELTALAAYIATVVAGLLIHGVFVLPALYWLFTRKSPLRFGLGMLEAVTVDFSTASSSATLPVSLECLEKNNGIPERVSRFVLNRRAGRACERPPPSFGVLS